MSGQSFTLLRCFKWVRPLRGVCGAKKSSKEADFFWPSFWPCIPKMGRKWLQSSRRWRWTNTANIRPDLLHLSQCNRCNNGWKTHFCCQNLIQLLLLDQLKRLWALEGNGWKTHTRTFVVKIGLRILLDQLKRFWGFGGKVGLRVLVNILTSSSFLPEKICESKHA